MRCLCLCLGADCVGLGECDMNAKEMFENSGYKIREENEDALIYERNGVYVVFEIKNKVQDSFEWYHGQKLVVYNTISTHLSIHQQMKELGWIE